MGPHDYNTAWTCFQWDPMITTLPGLYLASLPLLYPLAVILGSGDLTSVCTASTLRGLNIIFSVGNLYLLYLIAYRLHFNKKVWYLTKTALSLTLSE